MTNNDSIIALATPSGAGAIAVIRISGYQAITLCDKIFKAKSNKTLENQKSHTIHFGHMIRDESILDEVLVSLFKAPHSYTGENVVEISCHGSMYIQREIIQLFLRQGCRTANPGEFTLRAFLNGKLDLSQAEAVADLIASENEVSHQVAMQQMRGGFSHEIQALRGELLNFASLIELELDFAEEDIEFANREQFSELVDRIGKVIKTLIDSFAIGNVIKNGVPVAIVGEPNVGKSTLLNALLNEDKAIVSAIAGTTRDAIEDEMTINGIGFRFIDTAGIRETEDTIESIGIQKTFEKIEQARIVIFVAEAGDDTLIEQIEDIQTKYPNKLLIGVANKVDQINAAEISELSAKKDQLHLISAKTGSGIEKLKSSLTEFVHNGKLNTESTIVTNSRHYDALLKAQVEVVRVKDGLDQNLTGDLLAIDIKQALYHLGEITGEITNDDLLGNIFANFCIGK